MEEIEVDREIVFEMDIWGKMGSLKLNCVSLMEQNKWVQGKDTCAEKICRDFQVLALAQLA